MESFKATTQYGDWEGTAAADDAHESLHDYLEGKGLIKSDEFVLAVTFYSSEGFVLVRVFVFERGGEFESVKGALSANTGPVWVREVTLELMPDEFLKLFKRFDVMLTWRGLGLQGREYSVR